MPTESFAWPGYDANDPAHQTLQGFLVLDIQYSPEYAQAFLAELRRYRRGETATHEGSGNGYYFECRPAGLYLECLYDGDRLTPVTVPYAVAEEALEGWAAYCEG